MDKFAKHKQNIEMRLTELHARLDRIEAALDAPADPHLEDQAIELEDDEVLEGVGRAILREMRQLEEGLKRISNGTYGDCAKCGTEICEARLEAVPFAMLCRTCANAAGR